VNSKLKSLTWAAYAVAFLLIALPAMNVATTVLPFQWGQVQWRFGLAGIVANSLVLPLTGVFLALSTAALRDHRKTARTIAVFSLLAAFAGVLAVIMLSLDVLQLRPDVRVEALPRFDTTAGIAIAAYVLGIIGAILLGVGGWKAGRRSARAAAPPPRKTADHDEDSGVLVGEPREG
jgi:hypothetical protein